MTVRKLAISLAALAVMAVAMPAGAADATFRTRMDGERRYFTTGSRAYAVIYVGDKVTWRNTGDEDHTVTFYPDAPESYDSSPGFDQNGCDDGNPLTTEDCVGPGESTSQTLRKVGTYDFYCKPHGDKSVKPDPSVAADEQPCGMCGRVRVVSKQSGGGTTPTRSASPTPTKATTKASTSPSASPSASATATKSKGATDSPTASPTASGVAASAGSESGGGAGKLFLALLAIIALGGAGYATWKRFIATPP